MVNTFSFRHDNKGSFGNDFATHRIVSLRYTIGEEILLIKLNVATNPSEDLQPSSEPQATQHGMHYAL